MKIPSMSVNPESLVLFLLHSENFSVKYFSFVYMHKVVTF